MNAPFRSRFTLATLMLATATHAGAVAAGATVLHWQHVDRECALPAEARDSVLECGAYGRLVLSTDGFRILSCPVRSQGAEAPRVYPVEDDPGVPGQPCDQGSCLGRQGRPWVAEIDWGGFHGWSVAELIRRASEQRVDVVLIDLGEPHPSLPKELPGASDAQVLAHLCSVAERAAQLPDDLPSALNMSFGRRLEEAEREGCPPSGERLLSCEIRGVLAHLVDELEVPVVAAAGNHGSLLFPAADPHVLSSGALNLAAFALDPERPAPSSETPAAATVLLPGYGLYLLDAMTAESCWPLPPGSSYASAFFAGWLAALGTEEVGATVPHAPHTRRWAPLEAEGLYRLAADGVGIPGSALTADTLLIRRALGEIPEACRTAPTLPLPAVAVTVPAVGLPSASLIDVVAGRHTSSPGVRPCVPCQGEPEVPLGGELGPEAVLVDLSRSARLPAEYSLTGVYLRLGERIFALAGGQDPALLTALAAGSLPALELTGLSGRLEPGLQLSLHLTLKLEGDTEFWTAVPIALP